MTTLEPVVEVRIGFPGLRFRRLDRFVEHFDPPPSVGREVEPIPQESVGPGDRADDGVEFRRASAARPLPQPFGGAAAEPDRRGEVLGRGLQQFHCFEEVGLARSVRADEDIQSPEIEGRTVGSEGKQSAEADLTQERRAAGGGLHAAASLPARHAAPGARVIGQRAAVSRER